MKLEDLTKEIETDSFIDNLILDAESIKVPKLYSKYYRYFIDELRTYKGIELTYSQKYKEKFQYYLGKAPDEVYEENPLQHKILKQDLDIYMNADPDLMDLKIKMDMQKIKIDMIESFIKSLNNRTFMIKNAIDFMKFKNGEF